MGVGLAMAANVFMAFYLTGAAANPARWLGTALWESTYRAGAFRDHAVYWIGPVLGALLAGLIYQAVILPGEKESRASGHAPGSPAEAVRR
jgi:glycerol uptake facilitator-like aquaporin